MCNVQTIASHLNVTYSMTVLVKFVDTPPVDNCIPHGYKNDDLLFMKYK